MAAHLVSDIDVKSVYLKMINKSRGELNILINKLDRTLKAKDDCYNYLLARKGDILKTYGINLDDYVIEFKEQRFNKELSLETRVLKFLRHPKENANRQDIIQLAKWCSIIKNQPILNKSILLCKKKYNMKFTEFREYVCRYFMKIHSVLLEGDAYKFGNGIGTMYLKTIKLSEHKFHIDFNKTKQAKQALIDAGKTPYRREDAEYAKEKGLQYDGIQYLVKNTRKYDVRFEIKNSKFFSSRRALEFKPVDYVNLKYRGMSYDEIIKELISSERDIYPLQFSIGRKIHIIEKMNPGIFNRYIRNKK